MLLSKFAVKHHTISGNKEPSINKVEINEKGLFLTSFGFLLYSTCILFLHAIDQNDLPETEMTQCALILVLIICTAMRILKRLGIQTSSSFVKI